MSKIYVITEGIYSNYHICAVCSTREKAERAQELYHGSNVEEWDLDAIDDIPHGMARWEVRMKVDGDVLDAEKATYWGGDLKEQWYFYNSDGYGTEATRENAALFTSMFARDKEHAVKIANELRITLLASGEFDKWLEKQMQRAKEMLLRKRLQEQGFLTTLASGQHTPTRRTPEG